MSVHDVPSNSGEVGKHYLPSVVTKGSDELTRVVPVGAESQISDDIHELALEKFLLYEQEVEHYLSKKERIHPEFRMRILNLEVHFLHEKQTRLIELIKKANIDKNTKSSLLKKCSGSQFLARIAKKSTAEVLNTEVENMIKDKDKAVREQILKELKDIYWVSKYDFNYTPLVNVFQEKLVLLIRNSNLSAYKKEELIKVCSSKSMIEIFAKSHKAAEYKEEIVKSVEAADNKNDIHQALDQVYQVARFGFNEISLRYIPISEEREEELSKYSEVHNLSDVVREEILTFDTTLPHSMGQVHEYLDNRFSHTFVELVKSNLDKCEFFLGPKNDLIDYYRSQGYELAGELANSTSTNLLFSHPSNPEDIRIVFLDVNSQAMLNHICLMLKYSGISIDNNKVRGRLEYQTEGDIRALDAALKEIFKSKEGIPKVVIMGPRWWSMEHLGNKYKQRELQEKGGNIVEGDAYKALGVETVQAGGILFDTANLSNERGEMCVLAFKMPNGEIAGDVMKTLLKNGVNYVIMAGAGGSLDSVKSVVGSIQMITESAYYDQNETLDSDLILPLSLESLRHLCHHVTVDSPLVETEEWLENEQAASDSVDVETYHLFQELNRNKGVKVIPALFISDVVGTHPLTTPINVNNAYCELESFLLDSIDAIQNEESQKKE